MHTYFGNMPAIQELWSSCDRFADIYEKRKSDRLIWWRRNIKRWRKRHWNNDAGGMAVVLWTIQPIEVYELIQERGVYHCNFTKSVLNDCQEQYDWLAQEMKTRIGNPSEGVSYPVWAWYMWEGERKKPDLRRERWGNGWKGERFACMEIDIPEAEVILSEESRQEYREANWERAFELSYVDNDWVHRGDSIQATFWELRKEHIRKVRFFTSATPKPDYLDENGGTRNEG